MNDPMLELIVGEKTNVPTRRESDIQMHINSLRKEFVGKPEVCHAIVGYIVMIRRNLQVEDNYASMMAMYARYEAVILEHMDVRWLISICDTIADCAPSPKRHLALMASTIVNMIKICDTAQAISLNSTYDDAKIRETYQKELWDGVYAFSVRSGDMPRNLFARITEHMNQDAQMSRLWKVLFARIRKADNTLTRMSQLHQQGKFFED